MPRSESATPTLRTRLTSADWRGWLALAWVVWFGLLYGRMVVEQRGGKIRAAITRVAGGDESAQSVSRR